MTDSAERPAPFVVTRPGAIVSLRAGTLLVRARGERLGERSLETTSHLLTCGPVTVTAPALAALAARAVPLLALSRSGRLLGLFRPATGSPVDLRMAQARRLLTVEGAEALARDCVRGKLLAQGRLVEGLGRRSPAASRFLATLPDRLARLEATFGLDALRGVEGAATAAYYDALAAALPPRFRFERRTAHPGRDPANALLNLGSTALAAEAWAALEAAGLDPWLGGLHAPSRRRPALVYDLIEPLRAPWVEALVVELLCGDGLRLRDFHDEGPERGVRLTAGGLRRFFEAWERHAGAERVRLREELRGAVRRLSVWLAPEPAASDVSSEEAPCAG